MELFEIALGLGIIVAGAGLGLGLLFKKNNNAEESTPFSNITITNCGNTTMDNTKELDLLKEENHTLLEKLEYLEQAQEQIKNIFNEEFNKREIDKELEKYDNLINKYSNAIIVEKEKEIVKEVVIEKDNTTPIDEMYCINMHGFSVNKQYEYSSIGLRKTDEYKQWQREFFTEFNKLNIKNKILSEIDINKKIKAEYAFVKYSKNDVDNFAKSLTDTLCMCLNIYNDNMFEDISLRVIDNVSNKREGKIYFKLSNIE